MFEITRRKAMAVTGLSSILSFCGLSRSAEAKPAKTENVFDAVILGAGTAGLVAAIRAHDAGAKVVVLEKMDRPDGNSLYAMGTIYGWNSRHQKKLGQTDNRQDFFDSMMKVSSGRADPALTGTYTDRVGESLDWLQQEIGIDFEDQTTNRGRYHSVKSDGITGGGNLIKKLLAAAAKRHIPILYEHKAVELLSDDKGAVVGVVAQTAQKKKTFRTKGGVLVATGGFSANQEMTDKYIGGWASRLALRGSRSVTGENVTLTLPLFAKMVNMDQFHAGPIIAETHVNPNRILNSLRGIIVDLHGNRFVDEMESYVMKSKYCAEKTAENKAFCIVDSTCPALERELPRYDRLNSPYFRADTLEELCRLTHLPYAAVKKVTDDYNSAVEHGTLKDMVPPCSYKEGFKIEKAPFYAVPYEGGMTATFGGPLIDTQARVKNLENKVIPGLYAAGNAAGGLFFRNYNGGSQLGAACVFGTIAANEMAKRAKLAK